jgi:hypothetical protein
MVSRAFAEIQAVFATCPSTVCGREMRGVSQVFVSRRLQNSDAGNLDKVNCAKLSDVRPLSTLTRLRTDRRT